MPATDPHAAAAEVFAVLANPVRIRVLIALAAGGLRSGAVSKAVEITVQAGSQVLARLRHAGLVERTWGGQTQTYSLTPLGEWAASTAAALTDAA